MNNARLYMRLLRKPDPKPTMAKPVYERVPLFGLKVTDRRDSWRQRWEALEAEQSRKRAQELSAARISP